MSPSINEGSDTTRLGHGAAWRPLEGEDDDARAILGLMTMEEVRAERRRALEATTAGDQTDTRH
jgi:hypothetical protein